jgi:hypothetical protein
MAVASLGGMDMCCGRWVSLSPFMERRNWNIKSKYCEARMRTL